MILLNKLFNSIVKGITLQIKSNKNFIKNISSLSYSTIKPAASSIISSKLKVQAILFMTMDHKNKKKMIYLLQVFPLENCLLFGSLPLIKENLVWKSAKLWKKWVSKC